MSALAVIASILGALGALLGAFCGYLVYRLSRTTLREDKHKEQISAMVHAEYEPMLTRLTAIELQLKSIVDAAQQQHLATADVATGQRAISDRITVLETKMEVFWKNVALDVARVLHSPNPERSHVDELLEAFMDGRLSPEKREELKETLSYIRDYHQGDPSDFPIYPGDQVAAAILLQTMDLVRG